MTRSVKITGNMFSDVIYFVAVASLCIFETVLA